MCEWGYLIHNTDSISNVGKDGLYMRGRQNRQRWRSDCFITVPAISWLLCSYKCTLGCLTGNSGHGPSNPWLWPACTPSAWSVEGPGDSRGGRAPRAHRIHAMWPTRLSPEPRACGVQLSAAFAHHMLPRQPRKKRTIITDPHAFSSVPHTAEYPVGLAV